MARTDSVSVQPSTNGLGNSLYDLSRLLERLQKTLYQAPNSKLRSSYERNKVRANLEYARTLLISLEHAQLAQAKSKSASQETITARQAQLEEKRSVLRKLQHRLVELNQADDDSAASDASDESDADNDDFWDRYDPAIKNVSGGVNTRESGFASSSSNDEVSGSAAAAAAAVTLSSTLRSRKHGGAATVSDTATSTGTAISSSLPPAQPTTSPFAPAAAQGGNTASTLSSNDTLMAHHAAEQEKLTESLLTLATALKNSTKTFSETLAESNPLVDRATAALDRNLLGMGAAEKRMGSLRRMTEGRGWWARISLYAWIALLWVAAILIVFVMPKLRF